MKGNAVGQAAVDRDRDGDGDDDGDAGVAVAAAAGADADAGAADGVGGGDGAAVVGDVPQPPLRTRRVAAAAAGRLDNNNTCRGRAPVATKVRRLVTTSGAVRESSGTRCFLRPPA